MGWFKRRKTPDARGRTVLVFSAGQAAARLWTFGEDELVHRAENLSDEELRTLWRAAGTNLSRGDGLPLSTSLANDKVIALALIEHFEGQMRPLRQERRRPKTQMPPKLQNAQPVPPGAIHS